MKKIAKILYGFLFIFGLFFLGLSEPSFAQTNCTVTSAKFSEIDLTGTFNGNNTDLEIQTAGCEEGVTLKLKSIEENKDPRPARIDKAPYLFLPNTEGKIKINFEIGEDVCYYINQNQSSWGYHCISYIEIYSGGNLIFSGKNNSNLNQTYVRTTENSDDILRDSGILIGNCSDLGTAQCATGNLYEDDSDNWQFESVGPGTSQNTSNCNITKNDISFSGVGEFIKDASPVLTINTQGCENIPLQLSIIEEENDLLGWWGIDTEIDIDYKDKEGLEVLTLIPEKDVIKLTFKSTEEACDTTSEPDNCRIYVGLEYNNKFISTEEFLDNRDNNLAKGIILADCVEIENSRNCELAAGNWKLMFTDGVKAEGILDPVNVNILDLEQSFDSQSPCYVAVGEGNEENGVDPSKEGYAQNCYELLAPIPGIGEDGGNGRFSIDFSSYQIGQYIQSLFNVALGMLMLLSVIMIIVAGVEYMTVESIFGKSRAKGRITGAVTGLILGLGIFIILRTINPQLLEINFGSNVETQTIAYSKNQDNPEDLLQTVATNTSSNSDGTKYEARSSSSPELNNITAKIQQGVKIKEIKVSGTEGAKNGNAKIILTDGTTSGTIPIGFGLNGLSSNWKSGQKKSPVGTFKLGGNRLAKTPGNNKAVLSYSGKANLGAAFISVDQGPYVGIGIHGKAQKDSVASTYGCIRMKNSDLLAIFNGIDPGVSSLVITAI